MKDINEIIKSRLDILCPKDFPYSQMRADWFNELNRFTYANAMEYVYHNKINLGG